MNWEHLRIPRCWRGMTGRTRYILPEIITINTEQLCLYFATQTFLKALGHEAFLVRYVPQHKKKHKNIFKQIAKLFKPIYLKYAISIFTTPIKNKFINTFYQNHYIDRKFEIFRNKYFNATCLYSEKEL